MTDNFQLTSDAATPTPTRRRIYEMETSEQFLARCKAEKTAARAAERAQGKLVIDKAAKHWSPKQRAFNRELTDQTPMPFGKYKGRPMWDVDVGYLNWFLRECAGNPWCGPIRRYLESINAEKTPDKERTKK